MVLDTARGTADLPAPGKVNDVHDSAFLAYVKQTWPAAG